MLALLQAFFCVIFLIKFVRNSKDVVLWGFLGCLCYMLSIFLNDKIIGDVKYGKDIYIIHSDGDIDVSCKLHIYDYNDIEYKNK